LGIASRRGKLYWRFTAGDGGKVQDKSDSNSAVIMNPKVINDGKIHTITAIINIPRHEITLCIDSEFIYSAKSRRSFTRNEWSGGNLAGFGMWYGNDIAQRGVKKNGKVRHQGPYVLKLAPNVQNLPNALPPPVQVKSAKMVIDTIQQEILLPNAVKKTSAMELSVEQLRMLITGHVLKVLLETIVFLFVIPYLIKNERPRVLA